MKFSIKDFFIFCAGVFRKLIEYTLWKRGHKYTIDSFQIGYISVRKLSALRRSQKITWPKRVKHIGEINKITAQKMTFSIKDSFSKCDQIHSFLRIWSHLLKKSLMKICNFCTVKEIYRKGVSWNNDKWLPR